MRISYDYREMIQEFREELEDGTLHLNDAVYILRDKSREPYQPVIDWYYTKADSISTLKEVHPDIYAQFENDQPNLEVAKVKDILEEMVEMNRIL